MTNSSSRGTKKRGRSTQNDKRAGRTAGRAWEEGEGICWKVYNTEAKTAPEVRRSAMLETTEEERQTERKKGGGERRTREAKEERTIGAA